MITRTVNTDPINTDPITPNPIVMAGLSVALLISSAGGRAYAVGGAGGRDQYLRQPVKDLDMLIVGMTAETLTQALSNYHLDLVGARFGVFKVRIGEIELDLAFPREEVSTGAGHSDFLITVMNVTHHEQFRDAVIADLRRRDLTVNAMAVDILTGEVIDPFGGMDDLRAGILRAVGNPYERFTEDAARMLRVARFAARLNFTVDAATLQAMKDMAGTLRSVHVNPVRDELMKTVAGRYAPRGIQILVDTGLIDVVIPAWTAARGFDQRNRHHTESVEQHLLSVFARCCEITGDPVARLAALLHDVGKPGTFTVGSDGQGHFYGHDEAGAGLIRDLLGDGGLNAPHALRDAVTLIVERHMLAADAGHAAIRRLKHALGDSLDAFLAVYQADRTCHAGVDGSQILERVQFIRELPAPEATFDERNLALSGRALMALGIHGRDIGRVKLALTALVIDGTIPNEQQALLAHAHSSQLI